MKKYAKGSIGVVNANGGTIAAVLPLASGIFTLDGEVATNTTNVAWTDQVRWSDMISYTRTAYAAGTYGIMKIDFSSVSPAASTKYTLRVRQVTKPGELDTSQKFDKEVTVFSAASGETDLTLALKFYNAFLEISASSDIVVTNIPTAGSSTEFFYIQGVFANTAGTEYYDITASTNDTAIITITQSTPFVQQNGTPGIINALIPSAVSAGAEFTTYEFKYYMPVAGDPHGHKSLKPISGVIYVIAAAEAAFKAHLEDIFSGMYQVFLTITEITAAADASFACTGHGLSVGDRFKTIDITVANGDHQDEWQVGVENVWHAVKAVTDANNFTIELDTSGYDAAATDAKVMLENPYAGK